MKSFSERYGYIKPREVLQFESMDSALRNGLWNLVHLEVLGNSRSIYLKAADNESLHRFYRHIWMAHLKRPIDELPWRVRDAEAMLREYYFAHPWNRVYDFVECIIEYGRPGDSRFRSRFSIACNELLEAEMAAYRILDGRITPISDEQEITSIESALDKGRPSVREHLQKALHLLSDRKSPDFSNSLKESISAVEALAKSLCGDKHGTLGDLLKKLDERVSLHPSLRLAMDKLYGFTSDQGGIRHAHFDDIEQVDFNLAKFVLVTCSAFVNLVESKLAKD